MAGWKSMFHRVVVEHLFESFFKAIMIMCNPNKWRFLMFNRQMVGVAIPLVMLLGCGDMYSPGEDTADASLQRYTVEVRGMS